MSKHEKSLRNVDDREFHHYSHGGINSWMMDENKDLREKLKGQQEEGKLKIESLRRSSLGWLKNRVLVLSFDGWVVEQVPLTKTPASHQEIGFGGEKTRPSHAQIAGEGWIHLVARNKQTNQELAVSLSVGGKSRESGNINLIRREDASGAGFMDRTHQFNKGQTIFLVADENYFEIVVGSLAGARDAKIKIDAPSKRTYPLVRLIKG